MIEPVGLRDRTALIQQERERNRMLAEIFRGLPNTFLFFSGNIYKAGAECADLFFVRLKLSHALAAVGSPGSAKKFDDESAA
jgi:hypothetical protein